MQSLELERVRESANDKLLTLIMRKSVEQYQEFITSLSVTHQDHIVQRLAESSECVKQVVH